LDTVLEFWAFKLAFLYTMYIKMPISFDLEHLRKIHNCVNYFETGLYDPRTDVSSKLALFCGFDKVYCIEIRKDWVELGNQIFKEDIASTKYNLYWDDSTNMKKYLTSEHFKNKTMFFLDAHVDNANIANYKKICPLFDELEAIKSIERKDNIILIDDLRIIKEKFPWGETSYGDIDFLQQIKNTILTINKDYKFDELDGYIQNDVLLAYI
jgi:hypothetical protein